jgi:DNA adenine methylase
MKKLVSPLPWVGSKRQLRDRIIPRIPEHTCYAEPFAGGAWVYLGKQPSAVEVINDINGDLVNLYRAVRLHTDALYDTIWHMLPSRGEYDASKNILRTPVETKSEPDIERAALFYYHIKNAFGARFCSGFAFSKTRPPRSVIAHDLLIDLRERLLHTYIENLPYDRLVRNYDSPETFFYVDPPYLMDPGSACYQYDFKPAEHEILAKLLRKIKGKFLLSYGDRIEIRELYHGFKIDTVDVTYTLSGKAKKKTELLISNY